MKLGLKFGSESYQVKFDCPVPKFYPKYFTDFVRAYYYSAKKPSLLSINGISEEYRDLLLSYYKNEKIHLKDSRIDTVDNNKSLDPPFSPDKKRHVLMFTSGKDSLHLLLRLIEEYGKENILAIYCKNINKSENYYEIRSIAKICEKLGVKYKLIEVTNSIRLNRMNHNIGLREQLTLGTALPYILSFRAYKVWYGIYRAYDEMMPGVFSHHKSAFEFALKALEKLNIKIEIDNHIDYPIQNVKILEYLIEKHREIFFMSSSCYSQLNFREMHHAREQKKYPDIQLYQGCGICLKCLIANGGIYLYDQKALMSPDNQREKLKDQVIRGYKTKHPDDGALKQIYDLMTKGKCDNFVDR